ncbi:MAG: hypothetical protein JHD35_01870 [Sphingopyxis sp.]|nr:hypothetical protein [Sphingopyxis sp.]
MSSTQTPILLVGSIPLKDEAEVFIAASANLGDRLGAIPDGETGERTNWINWQKNVMERAPMLERLRHDDGYGAVQVDLYAEKKDRACERQFPPLGYAEAAIQSYASFRQLVESGKIAAGTRFQVALPTPFAPMMSFIEPESFAAIEPLYVEAMRREVDLICKAIPNEQLAIQWDAALEFAALEGVFPASVNDFGSLLGRMIELASWVPDNVKLGFHLCYGDAGHQHFKEPDDTLLMVQVMNQLADQVRRSIDWFHLPVPIARDDAAYFEPLSKLETDPETTIYLGLVHARDGLEGALRRARGAKQHLREFGIATECGFGRRSPETVSGLLALHTEIARTLDAASA